MFTLIEETNLTAVVNCEYPLKGGSTKTISFDIEFDRLNTHQFDALLSGSRIADVKKIAEVVGDQLVGWTGFKDHAGTPIEFNDEHLKQFCADAALVTAAGGAMLTAANGGARAKNSRAQRSGTRK